VAAHQLGSQTPQRWLRLRPIPLGFRAEGRQLVADEQQVVERIRQLAEGRSLREIADILTAEGYSPSARTGGRWAASG
jgi:hypothetical protein